MRRDDSSFEYRGKERMALLTGGRGAAGFAIAVALLLVRMFLRMGDDSDADRPFRAPRPLQTERVPEEVSASASAQANSLEAVLESIRSQGYRVTVHPLSGSIEMRATAYTDSASVKSVRVDRKGTRAEDELRCATALARQLGINQTE
jgi:hypothetical protein